MRSAHRLLLLTALAGAACAPSPRSYLRLPLASDGGPRVRPYIAEVSECGKRLLAVGTVHSRNPADPAFAELARRYEALRPTLVLHENVAPARIETTAEAAIRHGGEIGLMSFLARRDAVAFQSADLPEPEEFRQLLARYPKSTLLVFLTAQRLLTGLRIDAEAAADYPSFYADYLAPNGIVGEPSWRNWDGFKSVYRRVLGEDYSAEAFEPDRISPVRNLGPLNRLSRYAHGLRDARILVSLREALRSHDRVMLVFGAWHVLAIEPVLAGLVRRACTKRS